MITIEEARKLALDLEEAVEAPHFEKISFRVRKKIFATLDPEKRQVVLKLSSIDQSVFSAFDDSVIFPVPGAWGTKGWTVVDLDKAGKDIFADALKTSYREVAPKKLAESCKD
ncbi:MAG: MmcQ/YjbR family DNA-binding protein [Acidobacteria bacterium]|nr:MmcQ/YjbR family DNA-binding protein [Acidobacteriota bacterium]